MKSLLISGTYFPPQVGGISRIMESLARAMGPERVCCLTGVSADVGTLALEGGLRVYRAPSVFSDRAKCVRGAAWIRAMTAIMVRERPKVILLGTVSDGTYGRWVRRWLGLPYVVYTHGNEILGILATEGPGGRVSLDGEMLRNASRVVAVSQFTASLVQRAGVDTDRIDVVNPGCELGRFFPRPVDIELKMKVLGRRYQDRVIITTGNLVARKGHDMVIRALAKLRPDVPGVTYLIVGDGPYRSKLERLAAELEVRAQVVFAGRVADEELPLFYALADVFVMASRERREENDVEGFGLVYLEASACGKAVIGGRSGGIPEAVVEGVTGLLVDPSDPDDIVNALASVLMDRDLAFRLGAQGRARVVREFTWARAADCMEGVLVAAGSSDR